MLAAIAATVNTEGTSFEKPSLYFSPIAHAVSNAPATISRNQAMEPTRESGKSVYPVWQILARGGRALSCGAAPLDRPLPSQAAQAIRSRSGNNCFVASMVRSRLYYWKYNPGGLNGQL